MSRSKFLLHYFGEKWLETGESNTNLDDNIVNTKEKLEAKDEVKMLLEAVVALSQTVKGKHIVNVLMGKESAEVKSTKHNKSPFFGKGKEQGEKFWNAAIRQCLVGGYLSKQIEQYGVLKITPEGEDFIKKPESFMLIQDHDYDKMAEDANAVVNSKSAGAAGDEQLLAILKDLRKKLAKQRSIPPFVIFQDPSLQDMATQYPITIEELNNIVGVGAGKARKFGQQFIEVIEQYVKDNNIDRPQDFTVKTLVNKSSNKVAIIQGIDRKMPMADLAKSRGISEEEFVTELEQIVYSGTKLNLNYYIDGILDEEQQEEIYDYFLEAEEDSIEAAREEFDEDEYTEEELRLMRIKFLSEYGN